MNPSGTSPWHTLGIILGVAALIFIGIYTRVDGLTLWGYTLKFPLIEDFQEENRSVNMHALLENYHEVSKEREIRVNPFAEEIVAVPQRSIQYPDSTENPLVRWFEKLDRDSKKSVVRVVHYGDSQIEGDRITSRIREGLQRRFGGTGPGLQSFTPQVPSFSTRVEPSAGLKRYVGFTSNRDSLIEHGNYGPRFTLSRCDPEAGACEVRISPNPAGYRRTRQFSRLRVFWELKESARPASLQLAIRVNDSIELGRPMGALNALGGEWILPENTEAIELDAGTVPGDLLGFSLESAAGVVVDNVALRGSSGLIFTRADSGQLEHYLPAEEVGLLLLQFGGNVVPYLKDTLQIQRYASGLAKQIRNVRQRYPHAAVVFIGPSDMAVKQRTKMVTYPLLEPLRDALKSMALGNGAVYWDPFEAMGGAQSMVAWVEHEPAYAASDYVHFTPMGAALMGEWISTALLDAYDEWKAYEKAKKNEDR